jgi:hypothetical protein
MNIVIGTGIFLGAQGLVNLLNIIRHAGLEKEDNFFEEDKN